jgi:hypothetical protein
MKKSTLLSFYPYAFFQPLLFLSTRAFSDAPTIFTVNVNKPQNDYVILFVRNLCIFKFKMIILFLLYKTSTGKVVRNHKTILPAGTSQDLVN